MKLCFDSVEELRAFVKEELKGSRRGKGDDDEKPATGAAPAPLQPPTTFSPPTGAAPAPAPSQGFTVAAAIAVPFGGAAVDPAVTALVQRIVTKLDAAIASGQSSDAAVAWFRQQLGPDAASATLDQIKQSFIPKLPAAVLENFAKLMGA